MGKIKDTTEGQPNQFKLRHYEAKDIVLCVRWYLRYALSYWGLEEMIAERGLKVDHSTNARWVLAYAGELEKRVKPQLKPTNDSWKVDETYIKVKGEWVYVYRAVDSDGNTLEFRLSATPKPPKPSLKKRWAGLTQLNRASSTVGTGNLTLQRLSPSLTHFGVRFEQGCALRVGSTMSIVAVGGTK